MKLTIEIDMDGAAFKTHPRSPFAEAIDIIVRRLYRAENELGLLRGMPADSEWSLFDSNGNRAGKATVTQ